MGSSYDTCHEDSLEKQNQNNFCAGLYVGIVEECHVNKIPLGYPSHVT